MKNWDQETQDRRTQKRYKKVVDAICMVNGKPYMARTFDINQRGMGLLSDPNLPSARFYQVRCKLETETSAMFDVEEKQRLITTVEGEKVLRVGLLVINESLEIMNFFKELAQICLVEESQTFDRLNDNHHPWSLSSPAKGSISIKIPGTLMLLASIGNRVYECQTLAMGAWGIQVFAPEDFPVAEVFSMRCLDPEGVEFPILVRERNRSTVKKPRIGLRIGVEVIGGNQEFRKFVEKNGVWQ